MAMFVAGCIAGTVLLVVCAHMLSRHLLPDPDLVRARNALARRGIRFRTDALSACHGGLIVSFAADPGCAYCERCGDPIADGCCADFWTRYRETARAAGSGSADEGVWEVRDAVRIVREDVVERQGRALHRPTSVRR